MCPRRPSISGLVLALFAFASRLGAVNEEIPFVPTPIPVIDRMLELAEVGREDVVYDLGSGDGRIVIRAAKKYGARAVGIETDPELVALARASARREGVEHLVEFRRQNALDADLSGATVVTLYMLPWFNEAIRPKLERELKLGARVVAHDFGIEGWLPDVAIELPEPEIHPGGRVHRHKIFLWRVGKGPRRP
jgi:cyclopropane fatty-acyl-phospholipid synthase-like methyltransferase